MFLTLWRTAGGVKDRILSLSKTNSTKNYIKPKRAKNVYGTGSRPSKLKIQKQSKDNITKNIRHPFRVKKGNKTIKNRIIRNIKTISEQEKHYYKPVRVSSFGNNNYIKMKVMLIETKIYESISW